MRHLQLAELRDSWSVWLGVSLAFVITNATLALSAAVGVIGVRAVLDGRIDFWDSAAYTFAPGLNLLYCLVVGAVVIGSATSLVVESRRGGLARLSLAGATPTQVVATVMGQLVAVTVVCAIVGDLIALALIEPALAFSSRGGDSPQPPASYAVWPLVAANGLAVLAALLGGLRAAVRASRIGPVEALRQSRSGAEDRMTVWRWIGLAVCALACLAIFAAIAVLPSLSRSELFSNLFLSAVTLLILVAAALALAAPLVVAPVTRGWTMIIPGRHPVWHLARTSAVGRASRLSKTVIPVMLTIALLCGLIMISDVIEGVFAVLVPDGEISGVGLDATLGLIGMPLLVALSGGVGSLVLMSRQRDAELALAGIVGATPAQRMAIPALEGVIIAVTGTVLAAPPVGLCLVYLGIALPVSGFPFDLHPSYAAFTIGFGTCLLITVAATLLPTLRALRQPEPRVVARLVAD